jgi:hypothetical protein
MAAKVQSMPIVPQPSSVPVSSYRFTIVPPTPSVQEQIEDQEEAKNAGRLAEYSEDEQTK